MATFYWLIIAVIIGVLQVCTADPISVEEQTDVTKLFTASELERAKNAGMTDESLIEAKAYGYTFEEMIKIKQLHEDFEKSAKMNRFDVMTKVCEILVPEHRSVANHSNVLENHLTDLLGSMDDSPVDSLPFTRTSVCAYLSQPSLYETEAGSFGLQLISFMQFRFLKLKNRNTSGVERISVTKKMCCVYQGRDSSSDLILVSTFGSLSDGDLHKLDERWTAFEATNTAKSFVNIIFVSLFSNFFLAKRLPLPSFSSDPAAPVAPSS